MMPDTAPVTKALYHGVVRAVNSADLTDETKHGFKPVAALGVDWSCRKSVVEVLGANGRFLFDGAMFLDPPDDPSLKDHVYGIENTTLELRKLANYLIEQAFELKEYCSAGGNAPGVYIIDCAPALLLLLCCRWCLIPVSLSRTRTLCVPSAQMTAIGVRIGHDVRF